MFRNATMRLVAAHLLLVAVSTALVLGSLYWRIGGVIDTEQRAVVEAEIRGLADDFARGGTPALAADVTDLTSIRDAVGQAAAAFGGIS
ncbi:hypothetical protein, partial [Amaricoccus sp.]|uniref:hypothetical protein n=1 Tax=Amaricoccus sp. TaxID=1872485 RepID=UPI00262AECB6